MGRDSDRALGMGRPIQRREFIGGVAALAAAAGTTGPARGAPLSADYYPPALQGVRGSHPGSFESAHALRDAEGWNAIRRSAIDTGETYDLIVVGGGLSGLAAALFYRREHGPSARILILDNHDDFGGHAKRNEFTHDGRTYIGYGGTEQLYHGPWEFSDDVNGLLREVSVDTDRFYTAFDWTRYDRMQLSEGLFFDKETFGRDHLQAGEWKLPWPEFLAGTPLSDKAKQDIVALYANSIDYLPGLPVEEKMRRLGAMTYTEFLRDVAKVDPAVIPYFRSRTDRGTSSTDHMLALQARGSDILPGLEGMGLPAPRRRWKRNPEQIFHFPDGNAGVARMMVHKLIPAALRVRDQEEQVTARLDYSRLDQPTSPVRLRLSSTVVNARHLGAPSRAKEVEVTYMNGGRAYRARGGHVVMACYNAIIPHICPDLPAPQKAGLAHAVKSPLIYTNVLVRNWRPWTKLGVHFIHSLTGYFHEYKLDFPVDMGSYRSPSDPDQPIILHLEKRYWDHEPRAWENPQRTPAADRHRAGRAQLLGATFEDYEREIRTSMTRMLSGTEFDVGKDILGITVNRWPHGYAVGRDSLIGESWPAGQEPWVIGRQPFGRITIANSDAGAGALTQVAIDQALRAVRELV
jgi:spermidine dehydrogenase